MLSKNIDSRLRGALDKTSKYYPYLSYPVIPVIWFDILWPNNLDPKQINSLMFALNSSRYSRGTRFLVTATKSSIKYYIGIPVVHQGKLIKLIESFIPEAELSVTIMPKLASEKLAKITVNKRDNVLSGVDPEQLSQSIISSISGVGHKEKCFIELIIGGRIPAHKVEGKIASFHADSLRRTVLNAFLYGAKDLDNKSLTSLRDKFSVPSWRSTVVIGVNAANAKRREQLINHIADSFKGAETPGTIIKYKNLRNSLFSLEYTPHYWPLILNVNELGGFIGWPIGESSYEKIERISSHRLSVPNNITSSGRLIGISVLKDSRKELTLPVKDALMHTHVLGPTGVGKSTLLLNLISQDIKENRGVILIDPKGDLVNEVLCRIPKRRASDVIVLDPSDIDRPVGMNPLMSKDRMPSIVADDILSIFRKLYGSYFGPRSEDILHAGLLTLASIPGMSLCALPNLYTNSAFRYGLVNQLDDPFGLNSFWSWFDTVSDAQRNFVLAPVMNKLRAFLMRPAIRRVLGQSRPSLDMDNVLKNKQILLVNLAKGSMGTETSQLFGSLVVAQIWQSIQRRANISEDRRDPVFLYIDEVQDYLHLPTDMSEVLTQSRSYGVGMVLAHQHLGQLPRDLRNAVISNARTKICFQLGHEDAVAMSKSSKILTYEDFENLNRYHIYARLVRNGKVSGWMSGKTVSPVRRISDPDILKALSRHKYGRDSAEIDAELGGLLVGKLPKAEENKPGLTQFHKTLLRA